MKAESQRMLRKKALKVLCLSYDPHKNKKEKEKKVKPRRVAIDDLMHISGSCLSNAGRPHS